jgi:hypothetical protein
MKINVNHPSFLSFLDEVSTNITKSVSVTNYFTTDYDNKLGIQFLVFKFILNATSIRVNLTELELKSFITILCKKNEESENYEFASVLRDVINNFDSIYDVNKAQQAKKTPRKIRTNKSNE